MSWKHATNSKTAPLNFKFWLRPWHCQLLWTVTITSSSMIAVENLGCISTSKSSLTVRPFLSPIAFDFMHTLSIIGLLWVQGWTQLQAILGNWSISLSYPFYNKDLSMTSYKPNIDSKKLWKLVKNYKPKAKMQVK